MSNVREQLIALGIARPAPGGGLSIIDPAATAKAVAAEIDDETIREGLRCNKQGDPRNIGFNIERVLRLSPALEGKIRFNLLTKQVEVTGGPFEGLPPSDLPVAVENWLGQEWSLYSSATKVGEQLLYVARTYGAYDPVREYLESLEWDGEARLDTWLRDYCQAWTVDDSGADVSDYVSAVGARFLISAVARGMKPGAKVDTVLTLEGLQGKYKSTALRVMGGAWFSDTPIDLANKDSRMLAASKWIVELAELSALRRTEVESQKAFLSASSDDFRPPYGRAIETFARRCVFAGTTNDIDGGYLLDETGNRRWWCVRVDSIDVGALERDRDQLWAEAVARYRAGERWWFEADEQLIADQVADARRAESPWVAPILEWHRKAKSPDFFVLENVARDALQIGVADLHRHKKAIGAALRQAGFRYVRQLRNGERVRGWMPR